MSAIPITHVEPLTWKALVPLTLAMFTIAMGYGVVLPILPTVVEQLTQTTKIGAVSQHTGLLTGTYMLALFIFSPLWGKLSDVYGRKPTILGGLGGFAITMTASALADSLLGVYLGRFAAGLFSSAVAPASYALVGDHAPSKEWRARRYSLLNIAGTAGFLVGPMLGGLAMRAVELFAGREQTALLVPSLAASSLALASALGVWRLISNGAPAPASHEALKEVGQNRVIILRLLAISFATALAVGTFEVELALTAKQVLGLDPYRIGLMFAECSLVMFVAQAIVFSPLVKPDATRRLIAPALMVLAGGMVSMPVNTSFLPMTIAVAFIAAAAGVLSPIVVYWISVKGGEQQGTELGLQTAAASLGQAVGSAVGGLLFDLSVIPNAPSLIAAAIVVAAFAASLPLKHQLAPTSGTAP